jgi:hypothetical protein
MPLEGDLPVVHRFYEAECLEDRLEDEQIFSVIEEYL